MDAGVRASGAVDAHGFVRNLRRCGLQCRLDARGVALALKTVVVATVVLDAQYDGCGLPFDAQGTYYRDGRVRYPAMRSRTPSAI